MCSYWMLTHLLACACAVAMMATARKSAWLFVNRYDLGNSRWGVAILPQPVSGFSFGRTVGMVTFSVPGAQT